MIHGIGVDTVDTARFARQLERTPGLLDRLFVPAERGLRPESLAARFAAKEAIVKALGGSGPLGWQDLAVGRSPEGAPLFLRTPGLCAVLSARGLAHPHLSLTHDAGVATAFVVVERAATRPEEDPR